MGSSRTPPGAAETPRRLRVLISAYACRPGAGSEPGVAWRQLEALAADGDCHFVVLTRKKHQEPVETEARRTGLTNLEVVPVDLPRWARFWKRGDLAVHLYYSVWQLLAWRTATRLCREQRFDVAHHLSFMSFRTSFVPFLGVHSVVGPVGGAQLAPEGFGAILRHPFKERLRTLTIRVVTALPWWRAALRRTDHYVVANKDNLWIIPDEARTRCRVRQIGWKVDQALPAPSEGGVRMGGPLRIFWGGRLIGWKGLELLLRAAALAIAEGTPLRIDVTGKGEDEAYLRSMARTLGLTSVAHFHGFLSFDQVTQLQRAADVIAFTSLHETTGTALMEAMAAGKPTIVVAHAGPGEVADASTSWLVDTTSGPEAAIRDLAAGLQQLARDDERRHRMGEAARQRIATVFSWDAYIAFVKGLYLEGAGPAKQAD